MSLCHREEESLPKCTWEYSGGSGAPSEDIVQSFGEATD